MELVYLPGESQKKRKTYGNFVQLVVQTVLSLRFPLNQSVDRLYNTCIYIYRYKKYIDQPWIRQPPRIPKFLYFEVSRMARMNRFSYSGKTDWVTSICLWMLDILPSVCQLPSYDASLGCLNPHQINRMCPASSLFNPPFYASNLLGFVWVLIESELFFLKWACTLSQIFLWWLKPKQCPPLKSCQI